MFKNIKTNQNIKQKNFKTPSIFERDPIEL